MQYNVDHGWTNPILTDAIPQWVQTTGKLKTTLDFGPTAVTLNNLEAKADTQNNTAVLILAGAVLTLGVAVVAIRRRRIA